MERHQRNAASRVGLGTLIVGIVLSLMSFTAAPASATGHGVATGTTAHRSAQADIRALTRLVPAGPATHGCGPGVNLRTAQRCAGTGPQQFSEGGCGFLQRCLYFSRSEQQYLITGSKWIVQTALCAASIGLGCVAAGLLVELAAQWLLNRGGICPTSKPKLRVQWFPNPQVEGCVA